MLRRLAVTAALSVLTLAVAPMTARAEGGGQSAGGGAGAERLLMPSMPPPPVFAAPDRLHITVSGAEGSGDGTYELHCNPAGGSHPDPEGACRKLAELETDGGDPFAKEQGSGTGSPAADGSAAGEPVGTDAGSGAGDGKAPMCTMQYGGPATARITGTWHSRAVDVSYDRGNGCAISRWNRLVPVLPAAGRR